MYRTIICILCFLLSVSFSWSQNTDSIDLDSLHTQYTSIIEQDWSMIDVLVQDFIDDKQHRKEKFDCYARYLQLFFKTAYGQISAPLGYLGYYYSRKRITHKLQNFYNEKGLTNIEDIGNDIVNGVINIKELKEYLGTFDYNLWLYGDTKQPIENGGVPEDYKQSLPLFWRRWLYSAIRNPRWNAMYVNNYTSRIVGITTPYDNRLNITTHNYGTGDTKLGMVLRWVTDEEGKWWFFYENTRKTRGNKGKLFYFGIVGLSQIEDGEYKHGLKPNRFEFSLNRTVTIDENK